MSGIFKLIQLCSDWFRKRLASWDSDLQRKHYLDGKSQLPPKDRDGVNQ